MKRCTVLHHDDLADTIAVCSMMATGASWAVIGAALSAVQSPLAVGLQDTYPRRPTRIGIESEVIPGAVPMASKWCR
jgi:hypothetical protein